MFGRIRRVVLTLSAAGAMAVGMAAAGVAPAAADYGSGAQYQVEVSSNPGGFGFWLWAELGPGQTSDYQETDCIHLGGGHATDAAAHDSGSLSSWSAGNGTLTMNGMNIIAGAATANITVAYDGPQGQVKAITIVVTSEVAPFFPLNVPLTFPATGVVAP